MINWSEITDEKWRANSDAALAEELLCSRQNVTAARARLKAPASPEQRGGDRRSLQARDPATPTTFTFDLAHGQKVAIIEAAKKAGVKPGAWVLGKLGV